MKKIFAFIFTVLAAVLLQAPFLGTAEAAWVAVVPIEVDERQVERAADFQSYYWDVIIDRFKYPDYELVDDDKVSSIVPEEGLKSLDKVMLAEVADKTDADIVIAMRLDKVAQKGNYNVREPKVDCFMKGEFASFNRLTGVYYYKKMNYSDRMEEVLTHRNDWQQEAFASNLKRYINRGLTDKKSK